MNLAIYFYAHLQRPLSVYMPRQCTCLLLFSNISFQDEKLQALTSFGWLVIVSVEDKLLFFRATLHVSSCGQDIAAKSHVKAQNIVTP